MLRRQAADQALLVLRMDPGLAAQGKVLTPCTTSSALNPTLTHVAHSLVREGHIEQTGGHCPLLLGINSLFLSIWHLTTLSTAEKMGSWDKNCSPGTREEEKERRGEITLRHLLSGPGGLSSAPVRRGRPDRSPASSMRREGPSSRTATQMPLYKTGLSSASSSVTAQNSSPSTGAASSVVYHSQHVPVTFCLLSNTRWRICSMTYCFTPGPETVSAHSLNLLKPPVVSTCFGNRRGKKISDTVVYRRGLIYQRRVDRRSWAALTNSTPASS